MSLPHALAGTLPPETLPRDPEGSPVFRAPWEAQAFAMAVALHDAGVFTWTEWADTLGAASRGPDGEGESPYAAWLQALEALVAAKAIAPAEVLAARREAFDRAARATPHGQPILLANDPEAGLTAPAGSPAPAR